MEVRVPSYPWFGDKDLTLEFPGNWEVKVFKMNGHESPAISKDEVLRALRHPIGAKPLAEVAKGKDSAVIIFDDLTRPTKVGEIAEIVLRELRLEDITFVCANGAHGTFNRDDFAKKLGERIVESYPVFNHNPYENLQF
ncbi:MAG: lactate racemase domain-containing protein, partial [Archaeoglobaceae archaeon]